MINSFGLFEAAADRPMGQSARSPFRDERAEHVHFIRCCCNYFLASRYPNRKKTIDIVVLLCENILKLQTGLPNPERFAPTEKEGLEQ